MMTGITLLALETATEHCSVAIWQRNANGQLSVLARRQHAPRQQTELILPMVDELLAESGLALGQLTAIAYSCGPGAFTGVRIAAAVAQGLAFGADLPVVPVGSLQTLAQATHRQFGARLALAAFDARMQEVYAGAYAADAAGLMQPLTGDVAGAAAQLPETFLHAWRDAVSTSDGLAVAVGSGWESYRDSLEQALPVQHVYAELAPDAEDVALLASVSVDAGLAVAPELALPVYLRNDVWKKLPGR
ncbi:tRNA (adenosine(37)-N6)-threonylcarbamoyltransferase complex dimerization subunit type 1 TsaB [Perlucidibaca aquatica]|uniref:tRNA (adenosine(37)-N6)-threonylcarbamoyltransferase complex dimerization subunit type 1 TsaB n=1 Tax=Perlucidibaca aquatica TaxID=1852776 RepID=UPI000A8E0566|nr:tRNA (adenosine(37)-N6)-threonylcarbamoyltransferase complex dimerization subunit type 1 TsaB [Perlucidibaca aquatica]